MVNPLLKWAIHVVLVVTFAMLAGDSHAQKWYAETQVGTTYLNVPEFQFFVGFDGSGNVVERFTTDDGEDAGFSLGGRIGRILEQPLGSADGTRFEFHGFYAQTEQTTRRDIDGGFIALDNRISITFLGSSNQSTRRRIDYGGYDFLMHQDHWLSGNEMLSWYAGPSAIHMYQDRETGRIAPLLPKLEEVLNTDYLGGKTGLTYRRQLNSKWSFAADGSLGLYGAHSRYRGSQVVFRPLVQASRSRTDFALGSRSEVELKRALFRNSFIGGFASCQYLNYAPHMNYGSRDTDPNPQLLAIDKGDLFSASFGVRLMIFR